MTDSLASKLDVLVYLVPGYIVLLAALYACVPARLRINQERLGAGEVLASLLIALLLGIVIHRISAVVVLGGARVVFGESILEGMVRRFEHLGAVQGKIAGYLGFNPAHPLDCYYYGRILIDEKAPKTAIVAEHLWSMSSLCRNMLIAIPLAGLAVAVRLWKFASRKSLKVGVFLMAVGLLEVIFLKGFLAYWSASVWRILRAILLVPVLDIA